MERTMRLACVSASASRLAALRSVALASSCSNLNRRSLSPNASSCMGTPPLRHRNHRAKKLSSRLRVATCALLAPRISAKLHQQHAGLA